jgi:HD-GYP domain-containing protein (c-di-GMP phosphodiesterase class II)
MKGAISTSNASCAIIRRLPSRRNKDDADVASNHPSRKASSGNDSIKKKRPGLTRAFLEECITETQTQLKDALQRQQDFGECRRLQEKLDSLVQKRTEMPTLQELQEALSKAEQNVTRAVEHKDFSAASSFQEQVEELTQRLAAMEQDETAIEQDATSSLGCFKSRAQLEENITSLTMQIDAAVAQKDFATAATLQAQVVQLEAVRREFPTVAELKQSLIRTRKELQNAIAFKQFAVADKLQKRIDEMEHKLGEENTQEYPSVVSVPTPTKSPSGSSVDESKTPFDERSRSGQSNSCAISDSTPTKSPSGGGKPVY